MRKLMTALAAAATALFTIGSALADDVTLPSGTSFEGLSTGETNVTGFVSLTDAGGIDGSKYWFAEASDDTVTITNYGSEASTDLPALPNDVGRPDQHASADNSKFLSIDSTNLMYRTIAPRGTSVDEFEGIAIGDGLYLDTLVKFTAADSTNSLELASGDKIAIAYVESEDDVITNFVIRAGYIGSTITEQNYIATVPDDFSVTNWHRLTVRTIKGIDAAGHVGFVVYLDQKALAYTNETAGASFEPTGAAINFYSDTYRALYPSAVDNLATGGTSLSAVAFKGNGSVDDISFTTNTPSFIASTEAKVIEFTLGAGVTQLQLGSDVYDVTGVTSTNLMVGASVDSFALTVTCDTDNGYSLDTVTADKGCEYSEGTVTLTASPAALTIATTRANFSYIDSEDVACTASTLSNALANAKGGSTITLAYNYALADWNDAGYYVIDGKSVTLDLNGKTLDAGTDTKEEALFTVYEGAGFTIITSSAGGKVVYNTEYAIFYCAGDVYVGAASGDTGVAFDGILTDADAPPFIVRGYFDTASNGTEAFTFAGDVAEGSTCADTAVDGYWVVTPSSTPTVATIPTAVSDLTYDGTVKTGVEAGTGYTLEGNTATDAGEYTATATLEEGYVWSDSTTGAKEIEWTIAQKEVTPTLTLSATEATYDSTKTTPGAYATPTLSFGDDTLTEGTDYTAAWNTNEVTSAGGTFTYTVSPVADSNYTFTQVQATLTVTAASSSYPSYIDTTDEKAKAKYDAWVTSYGVSDTESAYKDAYLLNVAPDDVTAAKAAFKITTFTVDSTGTVSAYTTTTEYTTGKTYNGTVTLKRYSDVGCTKEDTAGTFFKAVLQ